MQFFSNLFALATHMIIHGAGVATNILGVLVRTDIYSAFGDPKFPWQRRERGTCVVYTMAKYFAQIQHLEDAHSQS